MIGESRHFEDQANDHDRDRGDHQKERQFRTIGIDSPCEHTGNAQNRTFHIVPKEKYHGTQSADMNGDINCRALVLGSDKVRKKNEVA